MWNSSSNNTGCSNRPSSKAAASEEARRTLRYVEPLSDARTMLADCFSILLRFRVPSETRQHPFDRFLHHRILIFEQRKQVVNGLLRPEPRE